MLKNMLTGMLAVFIAQAPIYADENWQLVGVERFYLHNPPNSFTGLYRSQGMARGDHEWYFSWQYGLERSDDGFNVLQRNSNFDPVTGLTPGIPPQLLNLGLNHIGDIDYRDGIIYAALDTTNGYNNGHVALYNASDLTFTGLAYPLVGAPDNEHDDLASWVAVDRKRDLGYAKEWQEGDTINVYDLKDWHFLRTIKMDVKLKNIQGGKVWGNWLYMSSDNESRSVYRANLRSGHVEKLFQLPQPDGSLEVEGIAVHKSRGSPLNLYVQMIVDPNYSDFSLADTLLNLSLFHYQLIEEEGNSPCHPDGSRKSRYQGNAEVDCNYELKDADRGKH